MKYPTLANSCHQNLLEFSELHAERCGGEIYRDDDVLMYAGHHPFALFNAVLPARSGVEGEPLIEKARKWFGERDRGFSIYVRNNGEDALLARDSDHAGLQEIIRRYPTMIRAKAIAPRPVEGLELRTVTDQAAAAEFWSLCGSAYPTIGFPEDFFEGLPGAYLTEAPIRATVAYRGDQPISCALAMARNAVGFVGWVATLPDERSSGAGAATTIQATNDCFAMGAKLASLQASPLGESIYRGLGYRNLYDYSLMAAQSPAAQAAEAAAEAEALEQLAKAELGEAEARAADG